MVTAGYALSRNRAGSKPYLRGSTAASPSYEAQTLGLALEYNDGRLQCVQSNRSETNSLSVPKMGVLSQAIKADPSPKGGDMTSTAPRVLITSRRMCYRRAWEGRMHGSLRLSLPPLSSRPSPGQAPKTPTARALVAEWKDGDPGMTLVAEVIASAFASGLAAAGRTRRSRSCLPAVRSWGQTDHERSRAVRER